LLFINSTGSKEYSGALVFPKYECCPMLCSEVVVLGEGGGEGGGDGGGEDGGKITVDDGGTNGGGFCLLLRNLPEFCFLLADEECFVFEVLIYLILLPHGALELPFLFDVLSFLVDAATAAATASLTS
jgi:hypothetical protein